MNNSSQLLEKSKEALFRIEPFHQIIKLWRSMNILQIWISPDGSIIIKAIIERLFEALARVVHLIQTCEGTCDVVVSRLVLEFVKCLDDLPFGASGWTSDGWGAWYVLFSDDIGARSWEFQALLEDYDFDLGCYVYVWCSIAVRDPCSLFGRWCKCISMDM